MRPAKSSTTNPARAPAGFTYDISDAEEARIQSGIAADPDNPELTDAQIVQLRPAHEVLPPALYAKLVRRGRPKAEVTKVPVKLRLDPDIVEAFRGTGQGWQTRINDLLKEAAGSLMPAARAALAVPKPAVTRKAKAAAPEQAARKAVVSPAPEAPHRPASPRKTAERT